VKGRVRNILFACLIILSINVVSGSPTLPEGMQEIWNLVDAVKTISSALGAVVITYAGIRWLVSESPSEREDAKKTIIYVVMALIVVSMTKELVDAIYCGTTNTLAPPYGGGIC
jgi:hypothetical protein